jgi:hypothetical protein
MADLFPDMLGHGEIERRLFLGGAIRALGHTVRHTVFSDGGLPGRGGLAGKKVQKMPHFYTVF